MSSTPVSQVSVQGSEVGERSPLSSAPITEAVAAIQRPASAPPIPLFPKRVRKLHLEIAPPPEDLKATTCPSTPIMPAPLARRAKEWNVFANLFSPPAQSKPQQNECKTDNDDSD